MPTKEPTPGKAKRKTARPPAAARANAYAYLTSHERAWLAGVIDAIGKVAPQRIMNVNREQRFISYRILIRSSPRANATIMVAAEMLRLKVRNYSKATGRTAWELNIPNASVDDLMSLLKEYLTAETYNTYIRAKYVSDLTAFRLEKAGWDYREGSLVNGKPTKRLYKGVDWRKIDEALSAPELNATDLKHIRNGVEKINATVAKSQALLE